MRNSLGYGTAWLVYAKGRGGVAVSICGALLLLHLSYSYSTLNYHFLPAAVLRAVAAGAAGAVAAPAVLAELGLAVQGQVVRNVVLTSAAAIAIVLIMARQGPAEPPSELMDPVWSRFLDTWQRGQSHVDRMFGGVQGPPVVVVGLAFGSTMQPRDNFELGSGPVLKIESPRARYWRTMSYAVYTGAGHGQRRCLRRPFRGGRGAAGAVRAAEAREDIEQRVTVLANQSNLVFGSDYPVKVDVPTLVEWRETQEDPAVVRLATMLRKGQQYTVTSAASVACRIAPAGREQYPKGIEKYLQLPPTVPEHVRQLAQEVTAAARPPTTRPLRWKPTSAPCPTRPRSRRRRPTVTGWTTPSLTCRPATRTRSLPQWW